MYSRLKIEYYKNLIRAMNVSRVNGKNNLAKPMLMLAILQGIQERSIIANRITLTESLVHTYKTLFKEYGIQVLTKYIYPYYYLKGDGFYHLIGDCNRKTPTAKYLRENIEYATFDDELWLLLQDEGARTEIKEAIIIFFIKPNK